MTEPTMVQTIISTLTSLVTAFAGYVTTWVSTIFASGNELLVVALVLPLVGVGITIIKRLMSGGNRL